MRRKRGVFFAGTYSDKRDFVNSEYDYLRRLYNYLVGNIDGTGISTLYEQGFTVREIEKLKGESKSSVSRKLNKEDLSDE